MSPGPITSAIDVPVKFVGVPRSVVERDVGEMQGWRHLGERMLQRARDLCPTSEEEVGWQGPHLKDALELKIITGGDPRILIGTSNPARADVLAYLTFGTVDHWVEPVNARVLSWTKGGTRYFSAGHTVKGISANDFILRAARSVAQEAV